MDSDQETVLQGSFSSEVDRALAEAKAHASKFRSSGKRQSQSSGAGEHLSSTIVSEAQKLFTPEQWRPIAKLPFYLAETATGSSRFEPKEEEISAIVPSLTLCAEYWLVVDPKWLALILLSANFSAIFMPKYAEYLKDKKSEEQLRKEVEKHGS